MVNVGAAPSYQGYCADSDNGQDLPISINWVPPQQLVYNKEYSVITHFFRVPWRIWPNTDIGVNLLGRGLAAFLMSCDRIIDLLLWIRFLFIGLRAALTYFIGLCNPA